MLTTVKTTKNKEQKNLLSEKGQTVLEFLIALTLIIFFLLGIVALEVYAIRNTKYAQNKSAAAKLARQQLERTRVVRDSAGINALDICQLGCFINEQLTPGAITPTGTYGQLLTIGSASVDDCPLPPVTITPPLPISYKAKAVVSWSQGAQVTPPQEVEISSCITDWR